MRTSKLCSGGKGISLRHGKQLLRCLPLVGMLFATSSVNAADSPGEVKKFNSDVRYSQWAINSRTNDFYANTMPFGLATYKADGTKLNDRNDKKEKLDYVPGLVSKSIIEAADYYQNFDWSKPWFFTVKEYGDAYFNLIPKTGESFDDLNGTKLYIGISNSKYATDVDKSNANTALASVKTGFINANKNYVIPARTLAEKNGYAVAGGWWHKEIYKNQMWLDGAYMGSALLAQLTRFYGASDNVFGSKEADWEMVAKQMNIVWNMCWNSTDKLMYHAFDATATATWYGLSSTTPYVFHSAAYWGRADAWYLYALVDVLEAMEADGQKSTTNYTTLKSHLDELAAGIAARQDKTTGGWYQLLDKDASFKSTKYNGSSKNDANYIETSATSLFSAAFFKAVRLGLLGDSYKDVAKNAFEGLVNNFMTYDTNGGIQIWGSCKSAGLGGNSYRDGSNEYYLSGSDVTMVNKGETTEGKVLGGFIMAATEYERAYQNQNKDNKQILFAKDLAPTYTINSSADVIDATAYGTDAEKATYQWYKDGKAVADATSATFSPTESGSYYCTATVGNNTIQTSTTTVTAKAATEGGDTSGETTAPSGKATFATADLKLLDSAPTENEKPELVDGNITIKAGNKIKGGDTNGIKVSKSDKSTFSIIANNNAKIKKVIITQTDNNRELNYNPVANSKSSNDKVFTYDYSTTKPSEITVSYNTGGNIYVTNIVVEYENEIVKTDLTASYNPATIDATEGDASAGVPTLTVKAGGKLFTEYILSDYTTTDANVAKVEDGKVVFVGEGTTTISVNVIPNNTTLYNGCTAGFTVNVKEKAVAPVEPTETTNVYDFKSNYGATTSGNTAIEVTADKIVFGANYKPLEGKYITITPADGGFKAGDLITIKGTSTKGNALMTLNSTLDSETSEQYQFNALGTTETTYQYLLQADCSVLYLGRASGSTATITGLTVTRAAAAENKTRLVATFPSNSITVVNTTRTVKLPELTVKAGDTELTNEQYTVVKKSDNPAVATISGDEITIKGIGTATIFATITPEDQTNYEGCIATYQVTVKEPTPLSVSTMDVTINTVDAEVKQPVIKVYGDNDKLLTLGKDYTLTYSVKGENVTVDEAGMFKVAGEPYKWTEGSSTVTVKATPTTTLGNTYKEGTLTFEYNVIKGKITPVFHEAFNGKTINVKNGSTKTFSVPLIYDGEDVSSYFVYTYTINSKQAASTGDTLTFKKTENGTYTIAVTAKPNTGKEGDDTDDYSQVYNEPAGISFTVKVGNFTRTIIREHPSTKGNKHCL
ncbi:glycoside hydrolase family 88 protein, partial [Prevotella sp.]|uniref:glycoside hydrolase family 88 protein n=1 Tax=Prevotella sp. TaxID=59823 RepID=UPI00307BC832